MTSDPMAVALDVTVRLAAAGLAIGGVETIVDRTAYTRGGPFDARVFEVLRGTRPPTVLAGAASVACLAAVQTLAALVLVAFGTFDVAGRVALGVAAVSSTLLRWRRVLGGDGAEQLTALVLISAALAVAPGWSTARTRIAVVFIAAQVVLAYFTAGLAKLVSPVWRSGAAVPAIVNTDGHGLFLAAHVFSLQPVLGRLAGWTVMAFELLFPLVLVSPAWLANAVLAIGLSFHVACAVVMGLNGFLWAFPATYPCVLACREALARASWTS